MSSWMNEDKRNWRRLFLVLLFVAIIGPWFFDRVSVPGQYTCSSIRLDEDFCGTPTTGLYIFLGAFGAIFNTGKGLFTQSMDLAAWSRIFFSGLILILLLLPFLTTLVVIRWPDRRRWQLFHMTILGLAAIGAGLFFSLPGFSGAHWMLWGPLLYICLAIGMLLWEALAFYEEGEPGL